ncbi:MAG: polyprenyl synthetase family protein [Actinomycetota bacterium]|nr:polyprenyl synthetase family protein [Actinomycetota bacterium]
MSDPFPGAPPEFRVLRDRFDEALRDFLGARHEEFEWSEPDATLLVDEMVRLLDAGGKRLRPAFCYWGYRAVGGEDDDHIVRAASALELLHTMAIVHDDLMDEAKERRGVESSRVHLAGEAGRRGLVGAPDLFGWSVAILVGDLSAVFADKLFLEAGFQPAATLRALERYHRMRIDMGVGQYLDIAGLAGEAGTARRAAALKGGAYTVEGPLMVGATLGGGSMHALAQLSRFGAPLGEAFQLRDDLEDGEGSHGATPATVNDLVDQAIASFEGTELAPDAVEALRTLARLVAMR